jgi:hypothetical protein
VKRGGRKKGRSPLMRGGRLRLILGGDRESDRRRSRGGEIFRPRIDEEDEGGKGGSRSDRSTALIPLCQHPDGSDMKRMRKKRDLRGIRDKSSKLLEINLR